MLQVSGPQIPAVSETFTNTSRYLPSVLKIPEENRENAVTKQAFMKNGKNVKALLLVSVLEYQLRLGRQRQVWFIPLADERRVCRKNREIP